MQPCVPIRAALQDYIPRSQQQQTFLPKQSCAPPLQWESEQERPLTFLSPSRAFILQGAVIGMLIN